MNTSTLVDDTVDTDTDSVVTALSDAAIAMQSGDAHPPSPLDRVALRVGLALILWSSRSAPHRVGDDRDHDRHRDDLARSGANERARLAREESWHAGALSLPRR